MEIYHATKIKGAKRVAPQGDWAYHELPRQIERHAFVHGFASSGGRGRACVFVGES